MGDLSAEASLPELLCLGARRDLPVSGVAVTLADETGLLQPLAVSDDRSSQLQKLQFTLGEGPCVDVVASGRLIQVPDLSGEGPARWPFYTPAVAKLGVQGLASFPLRIGGIRLGVLDLFRDTTGRLSDPELVLALEYVDAAVLILLHLQDHAAPMEARENWLDELFSGSLHGHPQVHQATGMVSVQAGISLTDALLLLRAHAYAEDRSIVDIAHDVVSRVLRFD